MSIFGRCVSIPRLEAWYGDPEAAYSYSGIAHEPNAWTPLLAGLRDRISAAAGVAFNSVLINRYRDGSDSNGWHSDDERELGPLPVIASLSLGATRRFVLRAKADHSVRREYRLEAGSLLIMPAGTQELFSHCVPKERRCNAQRLNLTFRRIVAR